MTETTMPNKEFREAGTVTDFYGDYVVVSVSPDGDVLLVITFNDEEEPRSLSAVLVPEKRDQLRELLDRAAMPGQETVPWTPRCDGCNGYCGTCEAATAAGGETA